MARAVLTVDFDDSGMKILDASCVIAVGETFDVRFTNVTFSGGTLALGMWGEDGTLVWATEGTPTQEEGGGYSLEGLRVATQEAQALFDGGAVFRTVGLTVLERLSDDETHDYGFARMRLYRGGETEEQYPPQPIVDYWTAEETQSAIAEAVRGLASKADVDSKIAAHNVSPEAHEDIREDVVRKTEAVVSKVSGSYSLSVYSTPYNNSTRMGFSFAYDYDENDYHTLDLLKAKEGIGQTTIHLKLPSIKNISALKTAIEQGDADTLDSAKEYANQRVAGVYRYKGSVETEADLPKTGNVTGDVWNVTEDGQNWAWDGEKWDSLRGIVDLGAYSTTEENDVRYVRVAQDLQNPQNITGALKVCGVHFQGSGNVWTNGQLSEGSQWLRERYAPKEDTENRLDALEEQMGDLLYKAIAFTSWSVSPSVAEVGSMVSSVTLKWALNKTPASLTLDGEALGVNERQKTLTGAWMILKTWVLKATDERGATETRNLTLAFQNKAYWGVGTATGTAIDDAFVLGLSGSAFATGRGRTFSANAGAEQYIYYVFPKSWGTPVFKVGGFEGGFALDREWEHTNASGAKTVYVAYRSTNAALGQTTVVVS